MLPSFPAGIPLVLAVLAAAVTAGCGDSSEPIDATSGMPTAGPGDTSPMGDATDSNEPETVGDEAPNAGDSTGGHGDDGDDGTNSAAPTIVLLTATPAELTENGDTMIIAQVTDPDGLDDVIGGLLKGADGRTTYAPFAQISEGTYAAVLTWGGIHSIEPISFQQAITRTFVAEFTDNDQNAGTEIIEILLTCDEMGACDGECDPLNSEEHCGSCDNSCIGGFCEFGRCEGGGTLSCGDGIVSAGEFCDGDNLQGFTCESLGLGSGTLACNPITCEFDVSGCG